MTGKVKCVVDSAKTLIKDKIYDTKVDGNGDVRVKGEDGRWNKYSPKNFVSVESDVVKSPVEAEERPIFKAGDKVVCVLSTKAGYLTEGKIYTVVETKPNLGVEPTTKYLIYVVNDVGRNILYLPFRFKHYVETEKVEITESITKNIVKEDKRVSKVTMRGFLELQGVPSGLIEKVIEFRKEYKIADHLIERVSKPKTLFLGGETWTAGIAALLAGRNVLLVGEKATGKNVFTMNLSMLFGRPLWDISCHTHIDAGSLIGSETYKNGSVQFKSGAVHDVFTYGGFGVLDEINMAKPEASAVIFSALDERRTIDVPGYDRINAHPASRLIGTMNYGYAGTRELNEAFVSRFVVIHIPALDADGVVTMLSGRFPQAEKSILRHYTKIFKDLQEKAKKGEISTRTVDLRGIIDGLELCKLGMTPFNALEVSLVNKAFDEYEKEIIRDVVKVNVSTSWVSGVVFPEKDVVSVDFSGVR